MTEADEGLIGALARSAAGLGAVVQRVEVTALHGGFVATSVERLDLTLSAAGQPSFVASFVRKRCPAREVRTLEAVAAVARADAAPELIAASVADDAREDPEASWFVSPFYPGQTLHFGDPIPASVLTTLARVHAATIADPPDWLWTCDASHIDRLQQSSERALDASARFKARTPDHAAWAVRLARAASAPALREAADELPRTLTHGDMHPANILTRADGSPVIIDWGNACLAPPMLDLANIIELGSPEWATYVAAYQATGNAFDSVVAERAYWWAKAMVGLMYIAWAVDNSDRAPDLIAQIETANARLVELPGARA
jgi:aminoglycoside phosphotransferase (APT) family kinase protein